MENKDLLLAGLLVLVAVLYLWQQHRQQQRLKQLEDNMYQALRQLWQEQNNLSQHARREQQELNDRLERRVGQMTELTDQNLERIRNTVDKRLNDTLEQKFARVGKSLADLHQGLGQMQNLAGGVNELKRILNNVKTRGIWGELQLGTLLKDMLPHSRIAENVEVRPRSGLRVEFALRLPGSENNEVLLPIDAKFPLEDYQRLQQAREAGDNAEVQNCLKLLERRLKGEAKDIHDKYICPPHSTDFAVMYLPSEGLFAEALSIAGLAEELQQKQRVCLAGPSTLAALVNSLQLGFRTLAVQKRTNEVWNLLNVVKQDMEALSLSLEKSEKKLEEAQNNLQLASKRVNKLSSRLGAVEELNHED